jgi:hypothetical protein
MARPLHRSHSEGEITMSAMHANVHVVEHAPARERSTKVEVRDHRDAKPQQVVVRDHRDDARRVEIRSDRDDDRARPVIVQAAPIVVSTPGYTTSWTPAQSYTYEPQPITLVSAASLASDQLSIDTTGELTGTTMLQLESTGAGSTYVNQVVAYDASGNYQVMTVNAMLSPSISPIRLALENGASVVRIAINGHSDWGGSIAVQAL